MSLVPVIVNVERVGRNKDGAGGKTKAWADVAGLTDLCATQNYYGRSSQLVRQEQSNHSSPGPGQDTRKLQLFVFRQCPQPDIQINDRIYKADGIRYLVLFVRSYEDTLQIDTEAQI